MPPVELVTGTLSALEDAFRDAVAAARRPDPLAPVTVVVGNTLLKRYLPRMLASDGTAHMNVRFLRPNELAQELARRAPLTSKPRLTPGIERLLVRQAASEARGYFAGIARGDGFVEALTRLFRELEMGGFGDAGSLGRGLSSDSDGNAAKFEELTRLYGDYLQRRERARLVAPAEDYAYADVSLFEGPLFLYGAWSAGELQLRLIERIAETHPVTVFLPATGLAADEAHHALRHRLANRATHRNATAPADGEIALLATRLFRPAAAPPRGRDESWRTNVELVSAPDTVREVWEAARTCMRWAEEGIGFHEMAVVYRNGDPYRNLVAEIFDEAEIPVYLHEGRLLAEHPLGHRLLALLDLAADPAFSRRKVMEFLTETRIPHATQLAYGPINPSLWEAHTREAGVVAGIEQWRARLTRLAGEKRAFAAAEGYEWYGAVADRIEGLLKFIDEFHSTLTSRPIEATWDDQLAYLSKIASKYADGVEPVIEALGDLRTMAAVAPRVTFEVFCRTVRDDLERRDASRPLGTPQRRFGQHGVAVLDTTSLRHLRFRAVHMVGVAERAWPPPPRPDPLLLEHERARLNANAGGPAIPMRTSPDDEGLTFWTGVQAAGERLAISYARAEAGGNGKHLPSYFFRATAEAILGETLTLEQLDRSGVVRRFAAGRLASDELGSSLSRAEYDRGLVKATLDGDLAGVGAIVEQDARFGRAIDARRQRWSRVLSPFDGVMASPEALARTQAVRFAREQAVSASRLETYATCPYRYFLRYALRIEPVDEPEAIERLDHLERGSLVHAVLERFLTEIGRDDPPRVEARDRHLALLRDVARTEGREREERGVTGRPLIWEQDQKQIRDDLERWYDAEVKAGAASALRPGALEASFGAPSYAGATSGSATSDHEPMTLRAGGRELRIQGRIDRIDWDDAKTMFRVIDYKTGRSQNRAAFEGGTSLQLPIYAHAAAQLLGMDVSQGEAQYFYVSSKGGFKRTRITGRELLDRGDDLERILATIAEGVDGGFFAPSPGNNKEHCRYCDYRDVCDTGIDRVMSRKLDDPRGSAFIALGAIE